MKRSLLSAAVLVGCLALVPAVSSASVPNNGNGGPPFGNGGNTNTNVAAASATNTTIVKIKNIIKVNSGKNHFKPVRNGKNNGPLNAVSSNGGNYDGGKHHGKKYKKDKNNNGNNHAVPEPGTMALLAAAMGAIVIRKRQSAK
ncbi:MAG: PEP-CTERM sorting domain-containing protein [Thermodesulfobacteriota bacterium]|nr:MAG: PEP-CTERM sorting domain-containing protein [Thermodesulfobacteriota bacterium]